jgi:hypothetical protein
MTNPYAVAAKQYGVPESLLRLLVSQESGKKNKMSDVFNIFSNCADWCDGSIGYVNTVYGENYEEALKNFIEGEAKNVSSGLYNAKFEDIDLSKAIDDEKDIKYEDTFDGLMQKRDMSYYFNGPADMTYLFKKDGKYGDFIIVVQKIKDATSRW